MTNQEEQATSALEALLAWARAERESNHRTTELYAMRRVEISQHAMARAPSSTATKEDLATATKIREAAEAALHSACALEDQAEEKIKELARALLIKEESDLHVKDSVCGAAVGGNGRFDSRSYPSCVLPRGHQGSHSSVAREFQGPGSGHPALCPCAACRNFDD